MFSLQTIFGKGDKFYGLLEASAAAAHESTRALVELLQAPAGQRSLDKFKLSRQLEKELSAKISQELVNTFVTALEPEDIEALNSVLYKIPKTVEKFAERFIIASERIGDVDFVSRAIMLEKSCEVIEQMVGLLRKGINMEATKGLNDKMQAIEAEADRLILEMYRDSYTRETDPMRYLILKDMFEILEKAIDRCRDVGNVIYQIVLKNS
ncbi:MAG TPA: pit accessory protein [Arenimonas sp.]|nr:pit accessory protein [Arenimonas sp.]HOZ06544.1 pit accessory protein [Arenimonas sp.]HPO25414.1 pit accessory protein [Arenimonas sp.]HPW32809.1 pit accessory protein [Arenimonas sp.]